MDVTEMQDTKANSKHSSCFKIASGGQVWSIRYREWWRNAKDVSSMRVFNLKCHYTQFIAMTPLELLHVDYMRIEMTMELNQSPKVVKVLVFQDHFMKHVMDYVTPNQTAKIVAKFLYPGDILIASAMAKPLVIRSGFYEPHYLGVVQAHGD